MLKAPDVEWQTWVGIPLLSLPGKPYSRVSERLMASFLSKFKLSVLITDSPGAIDYVQ